jgi:hypothetical protein
MVFLNYAAMQMTAKIVYYGPGLCGKTTNLQWIHDRTAPGARGEMVSIETETDRTVFFDLLPADVGVVGGMKVRLQLYAVPGPVAYNETRRLVLKGVDGVVFVADSRWSAAEPNEESVSNLRLNLVELGLDPRAVPTVFQYNKRDLGNVLPVEALQPALNPGGAPHFEAAAIQGVGVFETLGEISRLTLDSIRAKLGEQRAPAPPAPVPPPRVASADEAADTVQAPPARARGPLDLGKEMEKLRTLAAEGERRPSTVKGRDVDSLVRDLALSGGERSPPVERKASVEVPEDVLDGLTELRVHLGFDRNGREEILRDAVRVALARRRRLGRLRLKLDLELKSPG